MRAPGRTSCHEHLEKAALSTAEPPSLMADGFAHRAMSRAPARAPPGPAAGRSRPRALCWRRRLYGYGIPRRQSSRATEPPRALPVAATHFITIIFLVAEKPAVTNR